MAEAPKRSQVKSKFNLSKILKAFKRKSKRKGETENKDKDDVQTTTQFETSGLYSEIPAAASCKEHPYFQNSDNDVYLEPKRTDEQPYYSKALVSSDYLRPVFSDPSEHEIGGVFALPSARQAEQHRISEILKKQEVTDKTLFVNYEDPPEIPKRLTLPSPIKDGQQCAVTPRTVSADAAIGDSIPINLFENKEFDSQETGKDEDKTVVFRTDGTLSNEQNGSESLYRSSDFIEDVEADYDKTDNLVATSETLQNKNYSDNTKTISNMSKSIFLCVQNISPETTDETLSNYFEVISNKIGYPVDVSDIVHGKEGTAVIQLTGVIDFSKLSEELKKRPLENSVLQVCEVTNVNSAVISGEHSMPADNTIRNHFENDFGHVINVADIDIGMKVITFQDSSAARKICTQRNHNINETVLTVSLLYECAFGKMWDFKLHNLQQLPCDIQIKEIQPLLDVFIRSSNKLVRLLNDKLRIDFAKVSVDRDIVIKCTLSRSDSNFQKLTRAWKSRVEENWKKCLDDLTTKEELAVPEDISDKVLQFKQSIEQDYKDYILIVLNEKRNMTSLNIVGLKQFVHKKVLDLKKIIEEAETNSTSQSLQVTPYHIKLLETDGVMTVVETAQNVTIETKSLEGQIVIKGRKPNIDSAEMQIRKAISGFHSWTLDSYSNDHIELIKNSSVSIVIKQNLKDKGVSTEFELKNSRLLAHTSSVGSLKLVQTAINEMIVQHVLQLDEQCLTVIFSSQWEDYVAEVKLKYFGTVILRPDDCGNIVLTSLKDKHEEVLSHTKEIIARLKAHKDKAENTSTYEQLGPAKGNNIYQTLDTRATISVGEAASNAEKNAFVTAKRQIKVIIEEMPLTKKRVDVMACVTSHDLNLSFGQLLQSIRKDGGKIIEEDCKKKYPNGIESGKIAVVRSGNLPCSRLYFGYIPQYKIDPETAETALTKFVFDCLNMASKHGNSTIAFPSLGTGNRGYPHSVVAKLVYNAVKDFDKQTKSSTLHEIFLVLLPSDKESIRAFRCEESRQK